MNRTRCQSALIFVIQSGSDIVLSFGFRCSMNIPLSYLDIAITSNNVVALLAIML